MVHFFFITHFHQILLAADVNILFLAKTQRRKGRPFGTPAVAKDCVFIIVFWLFLGINLKPQTLNVKLLNLPLTFTSCLLPTAYCLLFISHFSSSPNIACGRCEHFVSRKGAKSQGSSLRDSGCSKRLCFYYSFLAVSTD